MSISQAAYLTGSSVLVCAICCNNSASFLGALKSLVSILKEEVGGGSGGGESDETAVISLCCSSEDRQATEDHGDVRGNVGVDFPRRCVPRLCTWMALPGARGLLLVGC